MYSLPTRFIIVFELFILLSSTIMYFLLPIALLALCADQEIPIADKAARYIQ